MRAVDIRLEKGAVVRLQASKDLTYQEVFEVSEALSTYARQMIVRERTERACPCCGGAK